MIVIMRDSSSPETTDPSKYQNIKYIWSSRKDLDKNRANHKIRKVLDLSQLWRYVFLVHIFSYIIDTNVLNLKYRKQLNLI